MTNATQRLFSQSAFLLGCNPWTDLREMDQGQGQCSKDSLGFAVPRPAEVRSRFHENQKSIFRQPYERLPGGLCLDRVSSTLVSAPKFTSSHRSQEPERNYSPRLLVTVEPSDLETACYLSLSYLVFEKDIYQYQTPNVCDVDSTRTRHSFNNTH